ncbi:MAG: 6,7-dimethyl-8-ribityllumazine synthase [Kiritimatiellae bacterium]|nr:6,7-dimethyl-8-ribityllumazine synthase [Kiritimatiellia bacterium]
MNELAGKLDAKGMKFALVVSRFNSFFTEQLLKGSQDCFVRHGGDENDLTLIRVPGANDIPTVVLKLAASKRYDAILAMGAVIQGATPHADLIENTVARALSQISLAHSIPVINSIIAAENLEQVIERAGSKMGNKGWDGVMAAIELVAVLRQI